MKLEFTATESKSSALWDFGWFDLSRFSVDGFAEGPRRCHDVLENFISHPISQRSFCTSPDPWGASVERHGPFPRGRLKIDWYRPLSHEELRQRVAIVLDNPEFTVSPSHEQRQPIEAWLNEAQADRDELLVLEEPPNARVDWDVWLLFQEFICFNPDRDELTTAVIGYD